MEEETGLSFGEILKVIFKRIWWVLGAMAIGVLVLVLCVELWYNKSREYYSISYEIVYPDSNGGKYPDGSTFLISDSVSKVTLESIVASDKDFEGIDVEKMVYSDRITVTETIKQEAGGTVRKTYTLTAYTDNFSSGTQAVKFLRTVANYPVDRANALVEGKDYRPYVSVYDSATTYEERIEALLAQKRYLQSEYQKLTSSDKSIESKLAALENVFTSTQRQNLQDTITANYYVLDTKGYKANAETRKVALSKQIADNVKIIEAEEAKRGDSNPNEVNTNPYDQIIAELTRRNAELNNEIKTIDKTIEAIEGYTQEGTDGNKAKQAFDELFDTYRSQLLEATDVLKAESIRIYEDNSNVIFSSNVVGKSGGMSAIIAAVLGAVIGLLVSSVIICIIDLPRYKKQKYGSAAPESAVEEKKDETAEEKE